MISNNLLLGWPRKNSQWKKSCGERLSAPRHHWRHAFVKWEMA